MSAYIVSDLDISDPAQLADYLRLAPPVIEKFGGRYLVRRGKITTLEGQWPPHGLVILEFPTAARAREWYDSAEYTEIRTRYFKGAKRNLIIVEGVLSAGP